MVYYRDNYYRSHSGAFLLREKTKEMKKRQKMWTIIIMVLAVICICGLAWAYFNGIEPSL